MLERISPSPVVTLNHAVAVAMVDGPAAGLRMINPLVQDKLLRPNHRLYAVRAHLLELDGQPQEAHADYATAARLTTSIPEQRYLIAQAERIVASADTPSGWRAGHGIAHHTEAVP